MRRAPLPHLAAALGLALVLSACGSSSEPPGDPGPTTPPTAPTSAPARTPDPTPTSPDVSTPAPGKPQEVTVIGTLEDGVETGCFVLTDEESGEVYSVTHDDMSEIGPGTRVKVTGHVDPNMMSYCQQGQILVVERVTDPDVE